LTPAWIPLLDKKGTHTASLGIFFKRTLSPSAEQSCPGAHLRRGQSSGHEFKPFEQLFIATQPRGTPCLKTKSVWSEHEGVRGPVKAALEEASGLVAGRDFGLCMNPEFLRQGSAIRDTLHPNRVVIGEYDQRSGQRLAELLEGFYGSGIPILRMSLESAEMVKYASNTFLAMKISYANEMARICERVPGIDVSEVMAGVGLDERINPKFLNAWAGFGGSCLPKDTKALCTFAEAQGYSAPLLRATLAVNQAQASHVAQLALSTLGEPRDKKVALLGLSFKPDTDDVREAPSLKVARARHRYRV
jgi:UDPglucose 6-dehydrogenase